MQHEAVQIPKTIQISRPEYEAVQIPKTIQISRPEFNFMCWKHESFSCVHAYLLLKYQVTFMLSTYLLSAVTLCVRQKWEERGKINHQEVPKKERPDQKWEQQTKMQ